MIVGLEPNYQKMQFLYFTIYMLQSEHKLCIK